jgi:CheY-like chemotaxis protein
LSKPTVQRTVLIAEDHPQTVQACAEAVQNAGCRALIAADLADAERIMARDAPALILIDAALPGGDIREFLARLRSSRAAAVLLLAPPRFSRERLDELRPLADDLLAKPFGTVALAERLRALLVPGKAADKYPQEGTDGRPRVRETAPEDLPGEIGGCRLERVLGRGATATVYLGRHVVLDLPVAVKVLRLTDVGWDRVELERFLRGARAAARIQHPNVVPVIHAGYDESICFLVQQYVEGVSLSRRLDREGKLAPPAARNAMADVAAGLAAAHRLDIIHRDVKPGNIILTASGRAMLTDFGLARSPADTSALTGSDLVGTPFYMSPEQCKGETLDGRSDLYSLGATAYHALAGRPPFPGRTPVEVLRAHANETPPPLGAILGGEGEALARVVMRLLEKRPEDRYPGADALLSDLARL